MPLREDNLFKYIQCIHNFLSFAILIVAEKFTINYRLGGIMKPTNALYHYQEKKMEPFGWILVFYIITLFFFLSIFMIIGPIKVFMDYLNVWSALLLPFVPLGVWLAIKTFRYARGAIWHNNHNAIYHFYRGHIDLIQWKETYKRDPEESRIDINTIEKIIVSQYIVNEYRTKHGGKHIDRNYILYIIYATKGKKKLFSLPLPNKDEQMNTWLTYFKELGLPVYFYNPILYRTDQPYFLNDEQRLEILDKEDDLVQLEYNGDWKQLKKELRNNWNYYSKINPLKVKVPALESDAELPYTGADEGSKKQPKVPFRLWANTTLFIYAAMIGFTFSLVEITREGYISPDNWVIVIIIFLLGSFLYFFFLRNYLRWYFMIVLAIKVFLYGFFAAISFEEDAIGVQVGENILAISMLFPLIVWLPYVAVKLIQSVNKKE